MAGLLNQLRTNGLSGHLNQWAEGNAQGITPDDVGQGLGQTILSNIASRAEFLFASQRTNSPPAATHHSEVAPGGKPKAPQVQSLATRAASAVL